MNFSKLLLALVAANATSATSMYFGGGINVGFKRPAVKTSKKMINEKVIKAAAVSGDQFESDGTGDDFGLKLKDDVKGYIPTGAFVSAIVTFDNLVGALSAGFGVDAGISYNANFEDKGWYGDHSDVAAAAAPSTKFAVKFPEWSFYATPKFLIGADIAAIHVLFSVGLEMSYATFKVKMNGAGTNTVVGDNSVVAETEAKAWLFGVKVGLEGIYQISDCAGVGLGIHGTYWPEAMNNVKEKDLAKKFNTTAGDSDDVFHVGGMWAVQGSLTGWFAFGA